MVKVDRPISARLVISCALDEETLMSETNIVSVRASVRLKLLTPES
jgi:hypothetical protein